MKNKLCAVAISSIFIAGTSCLAADGLYVKGNLKYAMPGDPTIEGVNIKSDDGY